MLKSSFALTRRGTMDTACVFVARHRSGSGDDKKRNAAHPIIYDMCEDRRRTAMSRNTSTCTHCAVISGLCSHWHALLVCVHLEAILVASYKQPRLCKEALHLLHGRLKGRRPVFRNPTSDCCDRGCNVLLVFLRRTCAFEALRT